MIYQSLPTIRAWSVPVVAPIYVLLALATGAVQMSLLQAVFGAPWWGTPIIAAVLLVAASLAKWDYWRRIDTAPRTWTVESATGLGAIGRVRPLDPPHTQANFVMREMGFVVARKHAAKLRSLVQVAGLRMPALLLVLAATLPAIEALLVTVLATAGVIVGVLAERWLFFAEAEHVVTLYYGAERV
jgi:DMSO reductase anchor subunit